jgi:hypothetical protein
MLIAHCVGETINLYAAIGRSVTRIYQQRRLISIGTLNIALCRVSAVTKPIDFGTPLKCESTWISCDISISYVLVLG